MRGGPLLVWRTDGSPAIGLTGKGASDIGDDFYACALNAGRGEGGPAIERVGRARFERGREPITARTMGYTHSPAG